MDLPGTTAVPAAALGLLPFAGLLLAVALLPTLRATRHWWEAASHQLALSLAAAGAGIAFHLLTGGSLARVGHSYLEYAAFLALLGSLYIISGGIHLEGAFGGTPRLNTLLLGLGAVLANLLGTTGASVVLIRPFLKANQTRRHKAHLAVFFIFIVSNCGGLLTPLGDPPLYLGFLRGVPFTWTLGLWKPWAVTLGLLLIVFYLLDRRLDARERSAGTRPASPAAPRFRLEGWTNVPLLAGVAGILLFSGMLVYPALEHRFGHGTAEWGALVFQIAALGCLTFVSLRRTPRRLREANDFSFDPLREVAILFLGVFGAMIPAMSALEALGPSLGISQPWQYFWATGGLSGFLDNAPTYLSFAALASGANGVDPMAMDLLAQKAPASLAAISCGAVFLGALSYIGNGPNFMVKAIAGKSGVSMPSFGGYLIWSAAVLLPILLIVTYLFFR